MQLTLLILSYPKLASGNAKTAADFMMAIAGGIEDATQAYVTTPATTAAIAVN